MQCFFFLLEITLILCCQSQRNVLCSWSVRNYLPLIYSSNHKKCIFFQLKTDVCFWKIRFIIYFAKSNKGCLWSAKSPKSAARTNEVENIVNHCKTLDILWAPSFLLLIGVIRRNQERVHLSFHREHQNDFPLQKVQMISPLNNRTKLR